ncbi:MAG: hypothetical protein IPN76_27080 [Saprospiraceae bacterium]|nr:hypothetical protein [Saprospiraceae bacterium]
MAAIALEVEQMNSCLIEHGHIIDTTNDQVGGAQIAPESEPIANSSWVIVTTSSREFHELEIYDSELVQEIHSPLSRFKTTFVPIAKTLGHTPHFVKPRDFNVSNLHFHSDKEESSVQAMSLGLKSLYYGCSRKKIRKGGESF